MINIAKQAALGEFLRKHRELTSGPAEVAQAAERKRRTPGLRREEVAQLAGISPTWYVRLEQGREITPSSAVLSRIADVLRLVPAERAYLFDLAGRVDPIANPNHGDELVYGTIKKCVLSISSPAYVLDKYWTLMFWNDALAKLFSLWLAGPEKNLLRHMFVDPNARTFVVDWELRARQLLGQFRVDFGKCIDDPKMLDLVRGLSEDSDFFQRSWRDQQALFRDGSVKSYNHPQLGALTFLQTTFFAAAEPSLKLVILIPCS